MVQASLTALTILITSRESGEGLAKYAEKSIVGTLKGAGEGGGGLVADGAILV